MSKNIVWGEDPALNRALAGWLAAKLQMPRPFREPYKTMGVFDAGNLVAVIILENFRPEDGTIEIGGASTSPKWLTRSVMKEMADFVFGKLGCQMAIFRTSGKNLALSALLQRSGMKFVEIPRLRGRDESELFFYLTDDAWDQNRLARKEVSHG